MTTKHAEPSTSGHRSSQPGLDQRGLFIVGMSRAATRWVGKCLNEHSQAAVFGENQFWGKQYREPGASGGYTAKDIKAILAHQRDGRMVNAYAGQGPGFMRVVNRDNIGEILERAYADLDEPVLPGELFKAACAAIAEAEGKRVAIDKTPQDIYWVERILSFLPEARFVSMMRDAYGFMLSYKHQGDRKPDRIKREFERLYHPISCALIWRAYVRASQRAVDAHSDRVIIVRFDEVRADPASVLARVQEHFDLPVEPLQDRVPADNTSFPGGKRPQLRGAEVFWMNLINRRLMQQAGFEPMRARFDPWGVLVSLVKLPVWMLRNVGPFKRAMNLPVLRYVNQLLLR